jgi:hypothetical protein
MSSPPRRLKAPRIGSISEGYADMQFLAISSNGTLIPTCAFSIFIEIDYII